MDRQGADMAERKGENQKLKMLYLVRIFSEETDDEHALTMPEIVTRLSEYGVNADRKTLYSDFALLREYGLDIITEQEGRNYLYHLGSRDFELPELKLLVDSVQSSRFIPVSDTRFRTTVTVAVSTHFLGWIMSLGKDISIVAPAPVVEKMKSEIARLKEQYDV